MVDQAQPVAVGRRRRGSVTSLDPGPRPRVRDAQLTCRARSRRRLGHARGSAAGTRRPAPSISRRPSSPSARASASTTSARPPVLAHGSHSAASIATRIGHGWASYAPLRAARRRRTRVSRATKPVHMPLPTGYDAASWTPSASPRSRPRASRSHPGSKASDASPTTSTGRGTRGRAACSAASTGRRGRATATRSRSSAGRPTGRACSTTPTFLAEYHDVLADFDRYMANGAGPLVPAPLRRRARRARSPTSAPSTASTSRSASTRAAWASSPATT